MQTYVSQWRDKRLVSKANDNLRPTPMAVDGEQTDDASDRSFYPDSVDCGWQLGGSHQWRSRSLTELCVSVSKGVPVYVMLPLDTITPDAGFKYASEQWFVHGLQLLAASGVRGVAVDVWWGIVEQQPRQYHWHAYEQLFKLVKELGLKLQVVLSFHACGGNVGDDVEIPLPKWVLQEGEHDKDLFFTSRPRGSGTGQLNRECLSFFADEAAGVLAGRSPMQCYAEFMESFRDAFKHELTTLIEEIVLGAGPCGELRYPSYVQAHGWKFPGIGEFQCYDRRALAALAAAAHDAGRPDWGFGGPDDAGMLNSLPEETGFFSEHGTWQSPYGEFFLSWYSSVLHKHGERLVKLACSVFGAYMAADRMQPGSAHSSGNSLASSDTISQPMLLQSTLNHNAHGQSASFSNLSAALADNGDCNGGCAARSLAAVSEEAIAEFDQKPIGSNCMGSLSGGCRGSVVADSPSSSFSSCENGSGNGLVHELPAHLGPQHGRAALQGGSVSAGSAQATALPSGLHRCPSNTGLIASAHQSAASTQDCVSMSEAGEDGRWCRSFSGSSLTQRSSVSALPPMLRWKNKKNLRLNLKIAGVHWWYRTASHAAELTAGYYNTRGRDGYIKLIEMCAAHNVDLTLTCVEMCDVQHPTEACCGPEGLLRQVRLAAAQARCALAGENALPCFSPHGVDTHALQRVVNNSQSWPLASQLQSKERVCSMPDLRSWCSSPNRSYPAYSQATCTPSPYTLPPCSPAPSYTLPPCSPAVCHTLPTCSPGSLDRSNHSSYGGSVSCLPSFTAERVSSLPHGLLLQNGQLCVSRHGSCNSVGVSALYENGLCCSSCDSTVKMCTRDKDDVSPHQNDNDKEDMLLRQNGARGAALPALKSFTFLRFGPELVQHSHEWVSFMHRIRAAG